MITIYLIRHGETLWNKKGRYQGIADVELSEKGILQADKIEDYLSEQDKALPYPMISP